MIGNYTVLYLNELEFKRALELNSTFTPAYEPYLSLRIINHYSETVFDGIICKGVPYNRSESLTRNDRNSHAILTHYYGRQAGYFTCDGVRFFRIIGISERDDKEGILVFKFQEVNTPSFLEKNTAFMIMPFGYPELNQFYARNIRRFLKESDLEIEVRRADDFKGTDVIADTILEQIRKCEFVICDITNCNKNVFFEIGYAKGLSKDIIFLLEQNRPTDFFDVNHIRRIEYSYQKQEQFQSLLRDTLLSIRNNRL